MLVIELDFLLNVLKLKFLFIQAVNTLTGAEMNLDGPVGQVYSMVVGNDMLFAGVQVALI